MNRKDLTKTVIMISNGKKHFGLQGFHKKIQLFNPFTTEDRFYVLNAIAIST